MQAAAAPAEILLAICLHNNAPAITGFAICTVNLIRYRVVCSEHIAAADCGRIMVATVNKVNRVGYSFCRFKFGGIGLTVYLKDCVFISSFNIVRVAARQIFVRVEDLHLIAAGSRCVILEFQICGIRICTRNAGDICSAGGTAALCGLDAILHGFRNGALCFDRFAVCAVARFADAQIIDRCIDARVNVHNVDALLQINGSCCGVPFVCCTEGNRRIHTIKNDGRVADINICRTGRSRLIPQREIVKSTVFHNDSEANTTASGYASAVQAGDIAAAGIAIKRRFRFDGRSCIAKQLIEVCKLGLIDLVQQRKRLLIDACVGDADKIVEEHIVVHGRKRLDRNGMRSGRQITILRLDPGHCLEQGRFHCNRFCLAAIKAEALLRIDRVMLIHVISHSPLTIAVNKFELVFTVHGDVDRVCQFRAGRHIDSAIARTGHIVGRIRRCSSRGSTTG